MPLSQKAHGWAGGHAVTMLTVYLVLLIAIPSSAAISSLGSLGRPAMLWGIVMLVWWVVAKLQSRVTDMRAFRDPIRFAYFAFIVVALVSFAVAIFRGQPADQVSPAFTALIRLMSWAGVLLIAADGIRTPNDLQRIVRRIGIAAGLLAALGLAQFITKSSLLEFVGQIPGITMPFVDVSERGGVSRVPGTATHPLEYATALNAALPLVIAAAVSRGFHWEQTKAKFGWWIPVALISLSALIAVSRSAIIGFAVAAMTMIPELPRRFRAVVIIGGAVLAAGAVIAIPGLLATTLNLFAGASNDPSTQSRTGGLARVPDFIAASPIVGAGFGTFLPRYYIFDNQWVLVAIELGVLGIIAFAAIFLAAMWSGLGARRRSTDPGIRLLGYALAASVVNIAVLFAFFDGLSFPQSGGIFFLIVGLCAAVRSLTFADDVLTAPRRPLA
ncbi:O-antigen ligase [Salinibacterium sp. M195]|uniref:O-antigen ligase family protein n=1 Tax=Salinibacterium sp. M195 TaxID=2583374 RepID=UPI001C62A614|nr:O-antigen ligase family protein [Salinibacterium sp. M195]QYH36951.1 O-antigen ligase family protein [Salinibacterium sp. M195]